MTSLLPPREIQSRIRAGETPEDVATAAQTTVEKVLVYAGPVLAERAHVAGLAQGASVRSADRSAGGAGTLGDLVDGRLRAAAVDAGAVEWDSWKRPDARWEVVADIALDGAVQRATFVHDVAGRYVTAEDDLARWLVGETSTRPGARRPAPAPAPPADGRTGSRDAGDAEIPLPPAPAEQTLRSVRDGDLEQGAPVSGVDAPADLSPGPGDASDDRTTAAEDDEQLTLGDDAIALVTGGRSLRAARGPADDWRGDGRTASWLETAAADGPVPDSLVEPDPDLDPGPTAEHPDESPAEPRTSPTGPDEQTQDVAVSSVDAPAPATPATPEAPAESPAQDVLFGEPDDAPEPAARSGRKRGRASIPSWDEIMFGGPSDGAPLAGGPDEDGS